MAIVRMALLREDWTPGSAFAPTGAWHYVCDTEAELPATATDGCTAATKDSGKYWVRAGGAWSTPSAGSGSDPWSYAKLANPFPTTSATAVDVTGLAFTPSANTTYEVEAVLLLRTATATVNPRPGLAWATGLTDGGAWITQSQVAAGAHITTSGNPNASLLEQVGGLPNTTQSWPAFLRALVIAGATPSGTVRVQLASETAGTTVTMIAGSFLKWRTV